MNPEAFRKTCSLLVVAGLLVVAIAWQRSASEAIEAWDPDRARAANRPIPVRTALVEQKDLSETIGGTAVTVPASTATIVIPTASFEGVDRQVTSVFASPGDAIGAGQTILEFDSSLFEQVVEQRQAELSKAQQEYQTLNRLYQNRSASGLQVRVAQVAMKSAELELGLARRDLELCLVSSPLAGVIHELDVVPMMRLSGNQRLATVHQLDPIHIQMDYPMERIDELTLGQEAEVVLDAFSQEKFAGTVVQISPVVATKTRVLPVTIEVPNPNNRIRAGISGFARLSVDRPAVTAVPTVAVIQNDEKAMVVRVVEDRAQLHEVRTGSVTRAGYVEVIDGLESGDEVLVYGQGDVEDEEILNVDWRAWTRREAESVDTP